MTRPRLLDLGCGAGGATRGYQQAGFHVTGVDHRPMPRYVGDDFILADMLEVPLDGYDAIHASPPCHDHSNLAALSGTDGTGFMLAAIRGRLQTSGLPWVIENVPGAPMRPDMRLCGAMFGLRVYRHRWFELAPDLFALQPGHPPHRIRASTRKRRADWDAGLFISVTGDVGTYVGREAMAIAWMTGPELSQAIPPAYSKYVGEALRAHLGVVA